MVSNQPINEWMDTEKYNLVEALRYIVTCVVLMMAKQMWSFPHFLNLDSILSFVIKCG